MPRPFALAALHMILRERTPLRDPSHYVGVPPFAARLLAARGANPDAPYGLSGMLAPDTMKGLPEAAARLRRAIDDRQRIVVIADYDCDGATACAIAMRGLRMFGADVDFLVPNRFTDGYGLTPAIVDRAVSKAPDLLLTVDNGIASVDGVKHATSLGIAVVVTDHHLPASTLPEAAAIVDPSQPGCAFPSKHLAGCGVMFYVLLALRRLYRDSGDPRAGAPLAELLDLLALGTIADLVRLDENNRTLVRAGLGRIRTGYAHPGIEQLFRASGRSSATATTEDLAFCIGPRINAAGRMDDASIGIHCLLTDDPSEAARLAGELHTTNLARRAVQEQIEGEALAAVEAACSAGRFTTVLMNPAWHQGVIGVVAGRLKEKLHTPSIVFTPEGDDLLKGSGRSISALHLRDALDLISKRHPDLIAKFGGHAMAAGLTIRRARFEEFAAAFEQVARERLSPTDIEEMLEHDGPMMPEDLTVENAEWIAREVWGQGFPPPRFLTPVEILSQKILKDKHLKLEVDFVGERAKGIFFGQAEMLPSEVMLLHRLSINEWQGNRSVEFAVERAVQRAVQPLDHARPSAGEGPSAATEG